jgi:hypothetical protein
MPPYITSPFKPSPTLLIPGFPTYLWGSWNDKTGPTQGTVLSDSGNGATSTVKFQLTSGNVPIVGALVTIVGTANAAGAYNVTNAKILSVSAPTNPDFGIYTITFSGTGNSASAADAGQLIIPQPEIAEALTAISSAPAVMPYGNATFNQNQGLTAVVSFPSLPTSVVVVLQQAVQDLDSEYATVATVATVSGGVVTAAGSQITVDPTLGRFFRFSNGTVTGGTLPTIIAKLLM